MSRVTMVISLDFQARHCRFESHWGRLTIFFPLRLFSLNVFLLSSATLYEKSFVASSWDTAFTLYTVKFTVCINSGTQLKKIQKLSKFLEMSVLMLQKWRWHNLCSNILISQEKVENRRNDSFDRIFSALLLKRKRRRDWEK